MRATLEAVLALLLAAAWLAVAATTDRDMRKAGTHAPPAEAAPEPAAVRPRAAAEPTSPADPSPQDRVAAAAPRR